MMVWLCATVNTNVAVWRDEFVSKISWKIEKTTEENMDKDDMKIWMLKAYIKTYGMARYE